MYRSKIKLQGSVLGKRGRFHCWREICLPAALTMVCRFVGWYRGGVMLWTCLCILGVDFSSFHPRFAKAETYGTGKPEYC